MLQFSLVRSLEDSSGTLIPDNRYLWDGFVNQVDGINTWQTCVIFYFSLDTVQFSNGLVERWHGREHAISYMYLNIACTPTSLGWRAIEHASHDCNLAHTPTSDGLGERWRPVDHGDICCFHHHHSMRRVPCDDDAPWWCWNGDRNSISQYWANVFEDFQINRAHVLTQHEQW